MAECGFVRRLVGRLDASRLQPREVEQRVHQLEETQRVSLCNLERLALEIGKRVVREQILDRSEHERERRAELVGHVREERCLCAVDPATLMRQRRIQDDAVPKRGR